MEVIFTGKQLALLRRAGKVYSFLYTGIIDHFLDTHEDISDREKVKFEGEPKIIDDIIDTLHHYSNYTGTPIEDVDASLKLKDKLQKL